VRSTRLAIIIGFLAMALLIAAACTSDAPEGPREPTPEFNPTPAGGAAPTAATAPEPTEAPAANAANGEKLFIANGCSACHSTGTNTIIGPGLAGVMERAATTVAGMSAEEYIEQSIRDPGAFLPDDFNNLMPATFASLPDNDIQDLVAYMSTLN
jgi:cytochrome c2